MFSFSCSLAKTHELIIYMRGIEWSLRAFASMRAMRLFLRARAVINFLSRAASTLEITNGEQRVFRKLSASWNLSFIKTLSVLRQVIWLTLSKQDNRRKLYPGLISSQ